MRKRKKYKDVVIQQIYILIRKIRRRNKDRVIALWLAHLKALFDAIKWRLSKGD